MLLPEMSFLGFALKIHYFKWKSSILARERGQKGEAILGNFPIDGLERKEYF